MEPPSRSELEYTLLQKRLQNERRPLLKRSDTWALIVSVATFALGAWTVWYTFTSGLIDDNLRMIELKKEALTLENARLELRKTRLHFEFDSLQAEVAQARIRLSGLTGDKKALAIAFEKYRDESIAKQMNLLYQIDFAKRTNPNHTDSLKILALTKQVAELTSDLIQCGVDSLFAAHWTMGRQFQQYQSALELSFVRHQLDECRRGRIY